MPEQFNLPLEQPKPPIETPSVKPVTENNPQASQSEFDFVLKDLYHQPLDEALENPLSDAFRKFRENNIAGRLKMIDADITEEQKAAGQKTYQEMFDTLSNTNRAVAAFLTTPTAIKGFISKCYKSLGRTKATSTPNRQSPPASSFPPISNHHKSMRAIKGLDAKSRATNDDSNI